MNDQTNNIDEKISAFLDGETSASEIDALVNDSRNQSSEEALRRYQLISRSLSGDRSRYSDADIAHRVMQQLTGEQVQMDNESDLKATPLIESRSWLSGLLSAGWMKPVAGVAVAGFVATVTILISQTQITTEQGGQIQTLAKQQNNYTPVKIELAPDVLAVAQPDVDLSNDPLRRQQVNNYLVNHSRSAAGSSYQGMVPFVRAVAFEPAQPAGDK